MNYSRWGNSFWYTFFRSHINRRGSPRDTALFQIHDVCKFPASVLRNNLEWCLGQVERKFNSSPPEIYRPTRRQMEELRGYIAQFLIDVNKKYPKPKKKRS